MKVHPKLLELSLQTYTDPANKKTKKQKHERFRSKPIAAKQSSIYDVGLHAQCRQTEVSLCSQACSITCLIGFHSAGGATARH